jgi:hypothetical protein
VSRHAVRVFLRPRVLRAVDRIGLAPMALHRACRRKPNG